MDLTEVCRTCLVSSESVRSIFSTVQLTNFEVSNLSVVEVLKLFDISITPDNGLPDIICCNCLEKIKQSYNFKLKFEQTEATFKHLKQSGKSDNNLNEYEHYTECFTKHEIPIIQQVKQEPEIEINMEGDFDEDLKDVRTNTGMFECVTCSQLFRYKSKFDQHMRIHTGEKPFQCKICLNKYRFKCGLKEHMLKAHGVTTPQNSKNSKLTCVTCSQIFQQKYKLDEHMRIHTGEKPFHCELCPNKYRYRCGLRKHVQSTHAVIASSTGTLKCATCSQLFRHEYELSEHMRIHTGEKPFQCEVCPKKFRINRSLTDHIQRLHADIKPNVRNFKCTTCSKLFQRNSQLIEHMTIHTGERPYECEACPKKFRLKFCLTEHIRNIHLGVRRKFKCEICSKIFKRANRLNQHMRVHTGEEPFECEVCLKKFRLRVSFISHMNRKHADLTGYTKKFKCETCSNLFECQARLNEHIRMHTGEKPFECEVCSKTFRIKSILTRHMQKMHADSEPNGSKLVPHTAEEPLQSGMQVILDNFK